jgi:hypothetical protein
MRRHVVPSPTLNALDAGIALLGVEVLRRLGFAGPSDAEILRFRGEPFDVESESRLLRERISEYLVNGMMVAGLERRAADAGK